jgi:hypothetical protein
MTNSTFEYHSWHLSFTLYRTRMIHKLLFSLIYFNINYFDINWNDLKILADLNRSTREGLLELKAN